MSAARLPRAERRATVPATAQSSQVRLSWLLGALGLLGLAALGCAYLSLCLLFVQGQWQLLYRPAQPSGPAATPADLNLPYADLRFGPNEAGVSELSGWWLPGAPVTGTTVLYLHDATASLSGSLPELAHLHALGCAVFAIEYRGYGNSASLHPSEASLVEDAGRALLYLTQTRHIPAASIVLWGRGTGATIATEAAEQQAPGTVLRLVLEDVNPPAAVLVGADPRTRLLPVRLLLQDRLDAAQALLHSTAPKLFLQPSSAPQSQLGAAPKGKRPGGPSPTDPLDRNWTQRVYAEAAPPKQIASVDDDAAQRTFLSGPSK